MSVYASLRASARDSKRKDKTWVGFGDPSYGDAGPGSELRRGLATLTRNVALLPLPGTREEVQAVADLFGARGQAFLGLEATEEAVRALPKGTPFLHFACHGLQDSALPMNSALVLTLPKQEGADKDHTHDGLLQAWEIMQDLRLDTDCVVLSACETALGQDQKEEGILGLSRAFFYAGARSLVVSQWAISDESTARLMKAFYKEILAGSPKDQALQRAQAILAATPGFAHPFHWAAFDLHGYGEH
jgi:CHAT domain-containing protein